MWKIVIFKKLGKKTPKQPYFKLVQYLCVQESSEDSFAWCEQGGMLGLEFLGF